MAELGLHFRQVAVPTPPPHKPCLPLPPRRSPGVWDRLCLAGWLQVPEGFAAAGPNHRAGKRAGRQWRFPGLCLLHSEKECRGHKPRVCYTLSHVKCVPSFTPPPPRTPASQPARQSPGGLPAPSNSTQPRRHNSLEMAPVPCWLRA